MKTKTIDFIIFFAFAISIFTFSCVDNSKQKTGSQNGNLDQVFWLNSDYSLWEAEVFVNGEPVLIDSGIPPEGANTSSGFRDITPFFVYGTNLISMNLKRTEASREEFSCGIDLVALEDIQGDEYITSLVGGISQMEGEPLFSDDGQYYGHHPGDPSDWPQQYRADIQFECYVPVQWAWQTGDVIENLTDKDKQNIVTEYQKLVEAYKTKNFSNIMKALTRWYPGTQPPTLSSQSTASIGLVRNHIVKSLSQADYEVVATPIEDLKFVHGNKLVILMPKNLCCSPFNKIVFTENGPSSRVLIYAGTSLKKQEQKNLSLPHTVQDVLYCFRKEGKWHLLPREWAFY